jgi:hypothetical protein
MGHIQLKEWIWLGSEVLDFEIEQTPNAERQFRIQLLLDYIYQTVEVEQAAENRAEQLQRMGFKLLDALHLACAEAGQAVFS